MNINDYTDLENVTLADLHAAIYQTEEQIKKCFKNKDMKGILEQIKLRIKLNKLLDKKLALVRKHK